MIDTSMLGNQFEMYYSSGNKYYQAGNYAIAKQCFVSAERIVMNYINKLGAEPPADMVKLVTDIHTLVELLNKKCQPKPKQPIAPVEDAKAEPAKDNAKPDKSTLFVQAQKPDITFADVAGLEDVKQQIRYKVLEPMSNPELAEKYNVKSGAKILLYGPPGTGKTFIAKAIAGEVDACMYAVNSQDLISKYMGESSKMLEQLFAEARSHERAIIFFDEFENVAAKRSEGGSGTEAEMARFVSAFLTLTDGFDKSQDNKMLLLIAATNLPWVIDPALLRGGRFDTHIFVDNPDSDARRFMVDRALANIPMLPEVDLDKFVEQLEGYGGGDVVSICQEVIQKAYMRAVASGNVEPIEPNDFDNVLMYRKKATTPEAIEKLKQFQQGLVN